MHAHDGMEAARNARSTPPFALLGSGGFVVLAFDVADRAANLTTFGRRSRLADATTDGPSMLVVCNGYSLFTQHFEDRW